MRACWWAGWWPDKAVVEQPPSAAPAWHNCCGASLGSLSALLSHFCLHSPNLLRLSWLCRRLSYTVTSVLSMKPGQPRLQPRPPGRAPDAMPPTPQVSRGWGLRAGAREVQRAAADWRRRQSARCRTSPQHLESGSPVALPSAPLPLTIQAAASPAPDWRCTAWPPSGPAAAPAATGASMLDALLATLGGEEGRPSARSGPSLQPLAEQPPAPLPPLPPAHRSPPGAPRRHAHPLPPPPDVPHNIIAALHTAATPAAASRCGVKLQRLAVVSHVQNLEVTFHSGRQQAAACAPASLAVEPALGPQPAFSLPCPPRRMQPICKLRRGRHRQQRLGHPRRRQRCPPRAAASLRMAGHLPASVGARRLEPGELLLASTGSICIMACHLTASKAADGWAAGWLHSLACYPHPAGVPWLIPRFSSPPAAPRAPLQAGLLGWLGMPGMGGWTNPTGHH